MSNDVPHFVFAGGVTGGHLFPGIAVAHQLRCRLPGARIAFASCGNVLERRHVARAGFPLLPICHQPQRQGAWQTLRFAADQIAAYRTAVRFLRKNPSTAVIALGGAACLPMARAAAHEGVPLILLEQNVIPGRATRWLAPRAALTCTAFEETREHLRANGPVRTTGVPLREEFSALHKNPQSLRRRLLILGGSQGAQGINGAAPRALHKVRHLLADWTIVHQTGHGKLEATRQLYEKLAIPARVVAFLDSPAAVMAGSELIVCRAGGTTLAELAAVGRPAVLLPYPHAQDDHQLHNALWFAQRGAATVVDSRCVPGRLDDQLAEALAGLLPDARRRSCMSAAMQRLARPDAAWQVAELILDPSSRLRFRAA